MMNATQIPRAHRAAAVLAVLALLVIGAGLPGVALAQSDAQVVRVEEDWELVVATPDPNSDAPQVTCVISPVENVDSVHAAFELNHQSMPDFVAGGLQLQIWNNEEHLGSRKFPNGSLLQTAGETVRWTQSLELSEGLLTFEITDGTSAAWGNFGGQGYLKASISSQLENLNGYSPTVSIANSGVGYAANRVASLVLRKVRLVTSTGEVLEAEPQVSVYPRQ